MTSRRRTRARPYGSAVGLTVRASSGRGHLVVGHEIGRAEDEDLADHVRALLIAAHEADHRPAGRVLDDRLEALAHDLLEDHALLDRRLGPVLRRAASARRA